MISQKNRGDRSPIVSREEFKGLRLNLQPTILKQDSLNEPNSAELAMGKPFELLQRLQVKMQSAVGID